MRTLAEACWDALLPCVVKGYSQNLLRREMWNPSQISCASAVQHLLWLHCSGSLWKCQHGFLSEGLGTQVCTHSNPTVLPVQEISPFQPSPELALRVPAQPAQSTLLAQPLSQGRCWPWAFVSLGSAGGWEWYVAEISLLLLILCQLNHVLSKRHFPAITLTRQHKPFVT